jgi:hypothetical protein
MPPFSIENKKWACSVSCLSLVWAVDPTILRIDKKGPILNINSVKFLINVLCVTKQHKKTLCVEKQPDNMCVDFCE